MTAMTEAATYIRRALADLRPVIEVATDAPAGSALDEIYDALAYYAEGLEAMAELLEGRPLDWQHMMAREAAARGI
jgi:hypothetical protein